MNIKSALKIAGMAVAGTSLGVAAFITLPSVAAETLSLAQGPAPKVAVSDHKDNSEIANDNNASVSSTAPVTSATKVKSSTFQSTTANDPTPTVTPDPTVTPTPIPPIFSSGDDGDDGDSQNGQDDGDDNGQENDD